MELDKLKHTLARNLAIGALGLATSLNMLVYNSGIAMSLSDKFKEITLTPQNVKEMNQLYISTINKIENIQNVAMGIGEAASVYLFLGLGIPLKNYIKNRKSLKEKID